MVHVIAWTIFAILVFTIVSTMMSLLAHLFMLVAVLGILIFAGFVLRSLLRNVSQGYDEDGH